MDYKTKQGSQTLNYKQEADSFCLQLNFDGDKLSIVLKDFNNWILYGKEFTEEDIGKDIHKKVELIDLCYSFTPAINHDDQTNQKEGIEGVQYKTYSFGKIVENSKGPCYKIERGGILTIYTNVSYHRANQQVKQTFQSVLKLEKIKSMTEVQIFVAKAELQKKQFHDKYDEQIEQLKLQNICINEKLLKMEKQSEQLRSSLEEYKQRTNRLQFEKNEGLQKMECLMIKFQKQKQKWQKYIRGQKKKALAVDTSTSFYNKFNVTGNKITLVGESTWTQILIDDEIPNNKIYSFKVKMTNTPSRNVMVGIVDRKKQKNTRYSQSTKDALCYYAANGHKYPNLGQEGAGLNQGQVVDVTVDPRNKSIKWSVNGSVRATAVSDICGDKSRELVPYIELFNTNDHVEWMGFQQRQYE